MSDRWRSRWGSLRLFTPAIVWLTARHPVGRSTYRERLERRGIGH